MKVEVIFDIETRKLFDDIDRDRIADLGVSVVSAYRREIDEGNNEIKGEMRSFWMEDLDELWPWMEEAERVIGFNSVRFDVPVLAPLYKKGDLGKLRHFDLLDKVKEKLGHRLSLNAIAKETLGETKSAVGIKAVEWWQAGDEESLKKLREYCETDVMVTKKVYDVGLREGKLKYMSRWNEPKEVEVDFSYPKVEAEPQMGLFG